MSDAEALLVGVDIGTTRIKAGVLDGSGRELTHARAPTEWVHTGLGDELDPERLVDVVIKVVEAALRNAPAGRVCGVGITSIAETLILLDRASKPIGRSPAWHDRRAAADFAELRRDLGRETIGAVTGLGTSQIPSVATLRWRRARGASHAVRALSVAEWVAFSLSGVQAAEPSLASRTGALAVATRRWWEEALAWAGVGTDFFPALSCAGTPFGRVRHPADALARLWGATVTVGGHDHLCAAVGVGATSPERVMDSCGSAEALVRSVPADPTRALAAGLEVGIETGCHVLAGFDALLGGLALGLHLSPILALLGARSELGATPLDAAALALGDDSLPAVAPSQVPALRETGDDAARAALASGAAPARIWRDAVASAVAGSLALLEGLRALAGGVDEVRLSGGWARNALLAHLKSGHFPPLVIPRVDEAGVRGAAMFAGQAAGLYAGPGEFPPAPVVPFVEVAPSSLQRSS